LGLLAVLGSNQELGLVSPIEDWSETTDIYGFCTPLLNIYDKKKVLDALPSAKIL